MMPARRWKMLDNTLYKLKNNKELTIGFFGGSITEGAGASDASRTSWRGSVMRWFSILEISKIRRGYIQYHLVPEFCKGLPIK